MLMSQPPCWEGKGVKKVYENGVNGYIIIEPKMAKVWIFLLKLLITIGGEDRNL